MKYYRRIYIVTSLIESMIKKTIRGDVRVKKYPFSNKAVKAMLAATIMFAPVAPTSGLLGETTAEASAITGTTCDAIDRVTLIYSKFNANEMALYDRARDGLASENFDWSMVLDSTVKANLNTALSPVTAEGMAKKFAEIIYNPNADQLKTSYSAFLSSAEGSKFESVMGSGTTDTILKFFVDAERALWDVGAGALLSGDLQSIESLIAGIQADLLNDPEYAALNSKLYQVMGTDLEGLYAMKDKINAELVDNGVLTVNEVTELRNAFVDAAWRAGEPADPSSSTRDCSLTPPPVTPPLNPPAPGESNNITLPEQAAEVVKEKNPSGRVEVITKIFAEKVDEIVGLITQEKDSVQVKLEKPAVGEAAKAQIPAGLFTKAALKNGKAVVEVSTDEASYKLPAAQIKIADLASKLGANEQDVQIVIAVNVVNETDVKDSVDKNKLKLASKVIEFTVTAEAGTKTEPVSKFSAYVERDITGEYDFDKENSAAVRLNPDGTISAIPTLFNGKTATVKSLTNSKYTIVENDKTFTDVKSGWAQEYIETLGAKYIIQGKATGEFEPGKHMTRAEFAVLLVRALGLPTEQYDKSFKDVLGIEWFAKNGELTAAVKYGVVQGKLDGTFAPNEKITRAQAAAMVERAMKISFVEYDFSQLDKTKTLNDFKDAKQVGSWAKSGVEAVYQAGIVKGKGDGTFNPNGYTQRNEMAAILANFLVSAQLLDDTFSK